MPLSIIKGHYRIAHSEPDGDSIHFYPQNRRAFRTLHLPARIHNGAVQLRLDAIDALETHYAPRTRGSFLQHQPLDLAHGARDQLLSLLDFTDVRLDGEMVRSSTPAQTEGYILTRFADTYGRPVSFAYAGRSEHEDLSAVHVDEQLLAASVNYQLVARGLVYPTYYSKLYPELRRSLTEAVAQARKDKAGVWSADATTNGATISNFDELDNQLVILPKLFRRLVDYLALGGGSASLSDFVEFLAARDDRLIVLSDQHVTGLDNITEVEGQTVRLTHPPEDLVFLEVTH